MNALRRLNAFMCSPAPVWVVRLLLGLLAAELLALTVLLVLREVAP